jgi:hypothetical protein
MDFRQLQQKRLFLIARLTEKKTMSILAFMLNSDISSRFHLFLTRASAFLPLNHKENLPIYEPLGEA